MWEQQFPQEPFALSLTNLKYDQQWKPPEEAQISKLNYNLHEATARQSAFYYQVCRPHMKDERYLRGAEQRYKSFLHLFRLSENKVFLVPTYDIDLLWHTHLLNMKAYEEDLMRILNRLLPHDDSVADRTPGGKLDKSSIATHKLWVKSYGFPYAREGAMHRHEPQAPIPSPPQSRKVTISMPESVITSFNYTPKASREVIQVLMTIVRARNLRVAKGSTVRVRLQVAKKCTRFQVESTELSPTGALDCTVSFEAERTTEALQIEVLERRYYSIKQKIYGSKVLGRMSLSWESLMRSPTLCHNNWFELSKPKTKSAFKRFARVKPAPSLFISLSWTPPQPGPHLFGTIESVPTDSQCRMVLDSSVAQVDGWMTRTVIDHVKREAFVVRARYDNGRGTIHVHEGDLVHYESNTNKESVSDKVLYSAKETVSNNSKRETRRVWSFFDGSVQLVVQKIGYPDLYCSKGVRLALKGSLKTQVVLAPGRRLQYEVAGAREENEVGYVTIIRYNSVDAPHGRATALLNWKAGTMEVSSEESVALVLMLSNIIAFSVLDMRDLKTTTVQPERILLARQTIGFSDDEWDSMVIKTTSSTLICTPFSYRCWWKFLPTWTYPHISLQDNWIKGKSGISIIRSRSEIAAYRAMVTARSRSNYALDGGGGGPGCGGCGGPGGCGGCGGCGGGG